MLIAALALLLSGGLSGCGGGAPPPAHAPGGTTQEEQTQDGYDQQYPQQQQPGYAPPSGGQPGYGQPATPIGPGGFAEPPASTLEDALTNLNAAESELSSAGSDCARACKALGSMERSEARICDLNGPEDPDSRCRKAKDRVDAARELLRRRACECSE